VKNLLSIIVLVLLVIGSFLLGRFIENKNKQNHVLKSAIINKTDNDSIAIRLIKGWDEQIVFISIDDSKMMITHVDQNTIDQYPNHGVLYYGEISERGLTRSINHHRVKDPLKDPLYGGLQASYYDVSGNGMPEYKFEKGKYYKASKTEWIKTTPSDIEEIREKLKRVHKK